MLAPGRTGRILLKELRDPKLPNYVHLYGLKLLPPNCINTVLDIGANVGLYSMAFRLFQQNARIISIEPDDENFKFLTSNLDNLNIETYQLALGKGGILYKASGESVSYYYTDKKEGVPEGASQCLSIPLNEIVTKFNVNTEKLFIKIDCEGGECSLFNHPPSEEIIKKSSVMSMELHNHFPGVLNLEDAQAWAKKNFGETHNIYFYAHTRRYSHLTIISKSINLVVQPQ